MLRLADIHVYRGETYVLKGIDLEVEAGEIVSLIGANGAGKTTTLATISGLLPLRQGHIWFRPAPDKDWVNIAAMPAERIVSLGISHCPEGRQIFGNLSVDENLRVGAYLRRDKAAIEADIREIRELFPVLAERATLPGGQLSGGEQMMLAIGRALMSRPRLMILDEPSLGLAPQLIEQVEGILRRIREQQNVTVLLVEQNAAMALELADRAYVLETGEIAFSGGGDELANHPEVRQAYLGGS